MFKSPVPVPPNKRPCFMLRKTHDVGDTTSHTTDGRQSEHHLLPPIHVGVAHTSDCSPSSSDKTGNWCECKMGIFFGDIVATTYDLILWKKWGLLGYIMVYIYIYGISVYTTKCASCKRKKEASFGGSLLSNKPHTKQIDETLVEG